MKLEMTAKMYGRFENSKYLIETGLRRLVHTNAHKAVRTTLVSVYLRQVIHSDGRRLEQDETWHTNQQYSRSRHPSARPARPEPARQVMGWMGQMEFLSER